MSIGQSVKVQGKQLADESDIFLEIVVLLGENIQ
jgi:hypothetical protein